MRYDEIVVRARDVFAQYEMALTLRQLFYRLVAKHVFANTINNYKALSRIMVEAREKGDIPDEFIEDRTRDIYGGDHGWEDPEDFLEKIKEGFRDSWQSFTRPIWNDQPRMVMVGVEKDALRRLVSDVADEYRVATCPTKGYGSYTYVKRLLGQFAETKTTVLLYFGDYDPSGLDIVRDLEERLEKYGAEDFQVKRIALTRDQIQRYGLPPMPTKKGDPRATKFVATHGNECVELDALEPPVLQRLISQAIEAEIDAEAWDATVQRVNREKESLKGKLKGLFLKWE